MQTPEKGFDLGCVSTGIVHTTEQFWHYSTLGLLGTSHITDDGIRRRPFEKEG